MKLTLSKIAGIACALLLGANLQAQSLSASQEHVIGIAAELYPDLFIGQSPVKSAQGYTYVSFNSGVSVGFKDGVLYVTGGPFGNAIQGKGTISQVTTQLTNLKNAVAVTPSADVTSLFNFAAQVYPDLFKNGGSFRTDAEGYLYKYFSTGVYAAIRNGQVFVKGGTYGSFYTSVGALNNVLDKLRTAANNNNPGGGTDIPSIPSGNYTLTVSGTVTAMGIATPINLTIANMPAPGVGDHDDIRGAFEDSMKDFPGLVINSFNYNVVSSSADRVEFTVSVSATITQSGFNLPYSFNLNYLYTK